MLTLRLSLIVLALLSLPTVGNAGLSIRRGTDLLECSRSDSFKVRLTAAGRLGRETDPTSARRLSQMASDDHPLVRLVARRALLGKASHHADLR
ncbi:MAG: hypothetical protein EXR76_01230 [Myxococcales bacterium]|nr:hypothetical protein [Myxococcales bacterium]